MLPRYWLRLGRLHWDRMRCVVGVGRYDHQGLIGHPDPIVHCDHDHRDDCGVGHVRYLRRGSRHRMRALNLSRLHWRNDRHLGSPRYRSGRTPRLLHLQHLRFSEDAEHGVHAAPEADVARAVDEQA